MNRRGFLKSLSVWAVSAALPIQLKFLGNQLPLELIQPPKQIRTFSDMLNDYLPNDLLRDELMKQNHFLTQIGKTEWKSSPVKIS